MSGFLWKPVSESDGKLVVLMPKGTDESSLTIKDASGNVLETAQRHGTYEDGRPLYRFSRSGAAYGNNVSVGGQSIANGAGRNGAGGSAQPQVEQPIPQLGSDAQGGDSEMYGGWWSNPFSSGKNVHQRSGGYGEHGGKIGPPEAPKPKNPFGSVNDIIRALGAGAGNPFSSGKKDE